MYREWPSTIPGAIAWTAESDGSAGRVLPDGCMDLLWINGELVVAGPDRTGFLSAQPPGARYAGLRLPPGSGHRSSACRRTTCATSESRLDELWSPAEVARLAEQVAAAPSAAAGLEGVVAGHARGPLTVDPTLAEVVRRARGGEPVASIAPAIGLSTRQLQRRALDAFGYGPKLLARILRLGDALALARQGAALAAVAAHCGYADQAHLADDVRALAGTTLGQLGLGARPQLVRRAGRRTGRRRCRRGRGRSRSAAPRTRPTARGGSRGRRATSASWAASTPAASPQSKASAIAAPAGRRRPRRVEGPDRRPGVEHQPEPAGEGRLDVGLGLPAGRDVDAEAAVEGERGRHVGDDDPDAVESRCHGDHGTDRPADGLGEIGRRRRCPVRPTSAMARAGRRRRSRSPGPIR